MNNTTSELLWSLNTAFRTGKIDDFFTAICSLAESNERLAASNERIADALERLSHSNDDQE